MAPEKRVSVRVLPPPRESAPDRLTVLLLMDGNNRWNDQRVDYGAGKRKLIEVARYLAAHDRVGTAVACVASHDNVAKRSPPFFRALRAAVLAFGAAIEAGALPGVRVGMAGDLAALRSRGGEAAACADGFEALVRATEQERAPRLELLLAVAYGPDLVRRTSTDLIVRTGMERQGAVRGSGLDAGEGEMWYGTPTLWPDLDVEELGATIDRCLARGARTFSGGFSAQAVGEVLEALAGAEGSPPLDVIVPAQRLEEQVSRALEQIYAGSRRVARRVVTYHVGRGGEATRRYGKRTPRHHVLRVVSGAAHPPEEVEVIVVPGQDAGGVTPPMSFPLGYANMLTCPATAEAIVTAAVGGARDVRRSPPLRGADRTPKEVTPPARAGRDPAEAAFVDEIVLWAVRAGLCADRDACPGTLAYLRTAYHMFPGEAAVATVVARYMMLAAVGDVFVFDRKLDDEPSAARLLRLQVSAQYLVDAIRGGRVPGALPKVTGASSLASIAAQWVALRAHLEGRAHPDLVRAWCSWAARHHEDCVREHLPEVTDNPLFRLLVSDPGAAREGMARYVALAPPALRAHLAELFDPLGERRSSATEAELRVLLYLLEVNTIGAGLAFRTAALAIGREDVPVEGPRALDEVLLLLDYRVRLANDLSDFEASSGADHDEKTNACSLLLPEGARGAEREAALMRAMGVVRRVTRLLDGALDRSLAQLATTWPRMAAWVRRGRHIGVTTYEVGHYTTIGGPDLDAILGGAGG